MRFAVRHGESGGASIGSVGACIVLNRAAPLQGGTGVDKGVTVDGERPGARRALNSRRSTAECAGELLHIGGRGGGRSWGRSWGCSRGRSRGRKSRGVANLGHGSLYLCSGDVRDKEVLGDDAAHGVIGIVASVALASAVGSLNRFQC